MCSSDLALTPAGLLQECTLPGALPAPLPAGSVADETVDISPTPFDFRDEDIDAYAEAVATLPRPPFPLPFAGRSRGHASPRPCWTPFGWAVTSGSGTLL